MPNTLIYDLLVILAGGLVATLICRCMRVSVLVGYLLVGIVIGKGGLNWVHDEHHEIAHLAEAGVFLLLFTIGLELSLDELWRMRRHVLLGGSAQMLLVAIPAFVLLQGFGLGWKSALLIGAATAFSSTVLVFKALSEWGHSNLPHGRRAIAILLFQDAALVPLLLVIPLLTGSANNVGITEFARLVAVSSCFVAGILLFRYVLSKHVVPLLTSYRNAELIVLFTLVCLGGITVVAHALGLPAAIGAFAAGLVFSGNRWAAQIDALMLPFRETFAAIFFVSLGLMFDVSFLLTEPLLLLGMLIALLVAKAIAATVSLRISGLLWQEAAGMGIGLAHVGEFAFVLVLLGAESGLIDATTYQRVIALAIGSLLLTPIALKAGLKWTQQTHDSSEYQESRTAGAVTNRAVVVGAGPIGAEVTCHLTESGCDVCLIDLSPVNLNRFAQSGIRTVAGDACDLEILEISGVVNAQLVVVAVPVDDMAIQIVGAIRSLNRDCFVLVRCRYQANEARLKKCGASQVISEEIQAGSAIVNELKRAPSVLSSSMM